MNEYTQCTFKKPNKKQTAWIPTKYAHVRSVIKIKINNVWDNGWVVDSVYGSRSKSHVESHERDYLKQRSASDI